jgi:hypothetical protein
VLVFLALTGFVLAALWPRSPDPGVAHPSPATAAVAAGNTDSANPEPDDAEAEARRARMATAYAQLEASRKALQRRLGEMKSRVWGMEMPADRARRVSDVMMGAQYLLRNPPQLGAFSDADGVYAEKARVDAALARLEEAERLIGEGGAPVPGSGTDG